MSRRRRELPVIPPGSPLGCLLALRGSEVQSIVFRVRDLRQWGGRADEGESLVCCTVNVDVLPSILFGEAHYRASFQSYAPLLPRILTRPSNTAENSPCYLLSFFAKNNGDQLFWHILWTQKNKYVCEDFCIAGGNGLEAERHGKEARQHEGLT